MNKSEITLLKSLVGAEKIHDFHEENQWMKHELAKIEDIKLAQVRIEKTVRKTPLQFNERLSKLFTN